MATYSALPATLNLVATVSNDFSLALTVTENGSPWVATGATLATDIIDSSGAVVATDFTTAASTGSVTLSLTDTQTGTLGVGVYSYRLSVTKSSLTRDWIAGTLSIVEAGVGGRSTSDVSLAITDTTISLTLNSLVASNAANIIVADAGGYFTGDDAEDALAEVGSLAIPLPAANGSDDTTAIQAILTVHAGKVIKGRPGQSYIISDPLVIASGTTLDMTGCTVTLAAGSDCNMVNNTAVSTSVRTVTDAAITSGTTSLTSASAAFTTADTGRSILVTGAASGASGVLCATMTYVNSTTVTLSVAASATVSGASATIYNRDSAITLRGGTWDRGANGGSVNNLHSLFFRRVDRLRIENLRCTSTAGKYFINPGDVTDCRISGIDLSCFSDGIHIHGPAARVHISNVMGSSGDDVVALGNTDYVYKDTFGDVTDVIVDGVTAKPTNTTAIVKLYGAAGNGGVVGASGGAGSSIIRNVIIRNIAALGCTGPVVSTDVDGSLDGILISGVNVTTSAARVVYVQTIQTAGTIVVENVLVPSTTTTFAAIIDQASTSTITNFTIRNVVATSTGTSCQMIDIKGAVTRLWITGCYLSALGSSGTLAVGSAANITHATVENCYQLGNSGGAMVRTTASGTQLQHIIMSNNTAQSLAFGAIDIYGTTTLYLNGHTSTAGSLVNLRTTAVAVILGDGPIRGSAVATTGSYTLRVNHANFQLDVSKINTAVNGDRCHNTAAASGVLPGAGQVVYDGTTWRQAAIGAVKTGTATLVGGTATVNDSAITANSVIRLAYKTIGGTPGGVYVSARTAATSFVITSTSGTDTSVIQYDIITY